MAKLSTNTTLKKLRKLAFAFLIENNIKGHQYKLAVPLGKLLREDIMGSAFLNNLPTKGKVLPRINPKRRNPSSFFEMRQP